MRASVTSNERHNRYLCSDSHYRRSQYGEDGTRIRGVCCLVSIPFPTLLAESLLLEQYTRLQIIPSLSVVHLLPIEVHHQVQRRRYYRYHVFGIKILIRRSKSSPTYITQMSDIMNNRSRIICCWLAHDFTKEYNVLSPY